MQKAGIEVVFWGADAGEQTWRRCEDHRALRPQHVPADALSPDNLLAYEMNGEPLPPLHGFPLRLIAAGWYGIANVKWLTRIEVRDQPIPGQLHGPRLRDDPGGGTRWRKGLDLYLGRPEATQVGASQSDETGHQLQHHGRGLGGADRGCGRTHRRW